MTYSGDPTSILSWLSARPRLLAHLPPSDLTRCACGATRELVTLTSPSGDYSVCTSCLGNDTVPRSR